MNLNYKKEYSLYNSVTDELINLYGIECQYIKTSKVELDINGFGEWQSLKAENGDVKPLNLLPENADAFEGEDQLYNQFGLSNFNEINLFISSSTLNSLFPNFNDSDGYNNMVNDLIVLPSNKVLEITRVEPMVPGLNNIFTSNNEKNVYKLYCTRYMFKQADNISNALNKAGVNNGLSNPNETNETLDDYFSKLLSDKDVTDDTKARGKIKLVIKDGLNLIETETINNDNITDNGMSTISNAKTKDVKAKRVSTKTDIDDNNFIDKSSTELGDLW